jgi:hypothetical protein
MRHKLLTVHESLAMSTSVGVDQPRTIRALLYSALVSATPHLNRGMMPHEGRQCSKIKCSIAAGVHVRTLLFPSCHMQEKLSMAGFKVQELGVGHRTK